MHHEIEFPTGDSWTFKFPSGTVLNIELTPDGLGVIDESGRILLSEVKRDGIWMEEWPVRHVYTLTLTKDERGAITWIGNRYRHGDELFDLLLDQIPADQEWSSPDDITFPLTEAQGQQIKLIGGDSGMLWDCFSSELVQKLNKFCDSVI